MLHVRPAKVLKYHQVPLLPLNMWIASQGTVILSMIFMPSKQGCLFQENAFDYGTLTAYLNEMLMMSLRRLCVGLLNVMDKETRTFRKYAYPEEHFRSPECSILLDD